MDEAPVTPQTPLALDTLSIFSGKDEQFAYKRALSRLLEMTSARYAAEEQWTPLTADARKWERGSELPSRRVAQTRRHDKAGENGCDDYADEAAYEQARPGGDVKVRPEAPRIRPRHVWGVGQDDSPLSRP